MKRLELEEGNSDQRLLVLYGSKPTSSTSETETERLPHLDSIRNSLLKFELSRNEVQVYLYLARVGADRAQNVAEVLSIHRTETYKILRKLEKQGLVSCTLEKPMRFVATSFEKALTNLIESRRQHLRILEKRKQEIVELWDALPKFERQELMSETLQILEGKNQTNARAEELLKGCKREIFIVGKEDYLLHLYNSTFFDNFGKLGKKRSLDARILTNFCQTTSFVLERVDLGEADFSYLEAEDDVPSFIISDCEEILFSLENEGDQYAVWTNYRSLVKSFRLLFLFLWKKSCIPALRESLRGLNC